MGNNGLVFGPCIKLPSTKIKHQIKGRLNKSSQILETKEASFVLLR